MEILLWLVPPVVVTLVAMAWAGWVGRDGRGEIDRDEAVRRLGAALEREPGRLPAAVHRQRQRSTGVALRRTQTPAASPTLSTEPSTEPSREPSTEPSREPAFDVSAGPTERRAAQPAKGPIAQPIQAAEHRESREERRAS